MEYYQAIRRSALGSQVFVAIAPSCVALRSFKAPPKLPIGVRTAETITTSFIKLFRKAKICEIAGSRTNQSCRGDLQIKIKQSRIESSGFGYHFPVKHRLKRFYTMQNVFTQLFIMQHRCQKALFYGSVYNVFYTLKRENK